MQMVNVGFPRLTWYGFEMVDGSAAASSKGMPASIENLRRIKFNRVFRKFSAI
jgi:hypothetical protein